MAISAHTSAVPSKNPDFFLARTERNDNAGLRTAIASLQGDTTKGEFRIDSTFSLAMTVETVAVFVFGLLLQRRREYITLRADGLEPSTATPSPE